MAAPLNQVFFPASFPELFSSWERFPDAVPYAGGSGFIHNHGKYNLILPNIILSLDNIKELFKVTRTERYLEIGAMVNLNHITLLGKVVPDILRQCLDQITSPQIKNIATIGGNICNKTRLLDTAIPMVALDAQYELRNQQFSRWISASRFHAVSELPVLNPRELLSRIRIPLFQWDYSLYKKFFNYKNSGVIFVFLLKIEKNLLTNIRVVFQYRSIFRDKNSESLLINKQLPLNHRDSDNFMDSFSLFLSENTVISDFNRKKLLNYMYLAINNFTS